MNKKIILALSAFGVAFSLTACSSSSSSGSDDDIVSSSSNDTEISSSSEVAISSSTGGNLEEMVFCYMYDPDYLEHQCLMISRAECYEAVAASLVMELTSCTGYPSTWTLVDGSNSSGGLSSSSSTGGNLEEMVFCYMYDPDYLDHQCLMISRADCDEVAEDYEVTELTSCTGYPSTWTLVEP